MEYATRVVQVDGGGEDPRSFDAECACGFTSGGWPDAVLAADRLAQHTTEHDTGEPAPELVEFRDERGLNGPVIERVGFDVSARADNRA